ncbi:A disintegrin and metalloproteinase with thrombospondin motifs 16 isoform X3 [Nilaparvata lugens]|uniref:A disintegrin and metalloproteinase with thrombospondin motifs 16 isoform X3 n=1 Tax=Nilaparvata lugens TaxID=108931 RepID=UPI00193DE6E1|nr:A disintegrin and metalloproteinase with thrombospondin motifs 16 isoform X3 [Nilaparvata lugens]
MVGAYSKCFAPVFLLVFGSCYVMASDIHKHMTKDDLRRVFHVDNHEDVPVYEVVRVHSVQKRDTDSVSDRHLRLRAFGRDLDLALKRTPSLFKDNLRVWTADSNSTGHLHYEELPQEPIGETFQDENSQAAILLHRDVHDGSLLLEGTIGHDLIVKPVPTGVRQHLDDKHSDDDDDLIEREKEDYIDDQLFLDDETAAGEAFVSPDGFPINGNAPNRTSFFGRRNPDIISHIVYKRNGSEEADLSDYAFMEPDGLPAHIRSKRSVKTKREAPYVIYPEILVIVDYDGYRLHGGDNVQIKRYFVSFWNGVDLRYKLLKGPKIRISIAGIIISRGRDATPYLERNRVGRDAIDSAAALTDMGKYLFRERRLPVYDIAVAVTKLDMCRRQYPNEACNRGTAGFAYVGGACVVNKRLEKVNSVAIIEDTGGFSGIIVAAHEVGHLLGAVHDGSPPPTYLGGPGAEKCRWEDGFIMSDLRHTEKGFRWSSCSVASFHHFLNGDTATCLYNSPHEDESLPRVLPGKLLTLDAQCRKDRGTSACFKDDRVCAQLFCFDAGSGYCVAYRPAAEGSPCGDGQFCTNGRCTAEHENIIPDYSQNTPAYLRRSDPDVASTQSRPVYANAPNGSTIRSEWNEFWRTAHDEITTPANDQNSITKPLYDKPKQNQITHTTPQYLLNREKVNLPAVTLGNSIENNLRPDISHSTPRNPYDFADLISRKPIDNVQTTKKSNFNFHGYTFTTSNRPTTKNVYEEYNKKFFSSSADDTDCVDTATNLNCAEFLTKYGYQYCGTHFIRKHCCAAQKYLCDGKTKTARR